MKSVHVLFLVEGVAAVKRMKQASQWRTIRWIGLPRTVLEGMQHLSPHVIILPETVAFGSHLPGRPYA
jgi:hypothetical protein